MPKHDYRMPTRRERELFKQARELQARIDALEKDPSAKLEISRLEDIVAERDAAVSELESELESERARTARVRIDLEKSRAKRKGLESQVRQLRCDVGNERARTRSAQARYERMSGSHGLLLEENRSLKARNSELEEELARKDALIEHLNARLSRGPENELYRFLGHGSPLLRNFYGACPVEIFAAGPAGPAAPCKIQAPGETRRAAWRTRPLTQTSTGWNAPAT